MRTGRTIGVGLLLAVTACGPTEERRGPAYAQGFAADAALDEFLFSDPADWSRSEAGGRPALDHVGENRYQPPHRSPHNLALVKDHLFGDFVLEAELQQTGREYGHRDLCLIFGFQSPSKYYYVHLAPKPDDHAHNVFLVNDAPRTRLADVSSDGVDWGEDAWHRVRLERTLEDGAIRVYFGGAEAPILTATDHTLGWGRVGFGSFDDQGRIADLRVWADEVRPAPGGSPFPTN